MLASIPTPQLIAGAKYAISKSAKLFNNKKNYLFLAFRIFIHLGLPSGILNQEAQITFALLMVIIANVLRLVKIVPSFV